jgi:hypothetical protein
MNCPPPSYTSARSPHRQDTGNTRQRGAAPPRGNQRGTSTGPTGMDVGPNPQEAGTNRGNTHGYAHHPPGSELRTIEEDDPEDYGTLPSTPSAPIYPSRQTDIQTSANPTWGPYTETFLTLLYIESQDTDHADTDNAQPPTTRDTHDEAFIANLAAEHEATAAAEAAAATAIAEAEARAEAEAETSAEAAAAAAKTKVAAVATTNNTELEATSATTLAETAWTTEQPRPRHIQRQRPWRPNLQGRTPRELQSCSGPKKLDFHWTRMIGSSLREDSLRDPPYMAAKLSWTNTLKMKRTPRR